MSDTLLDLKERLIQSLFRVKGMASNIHTGGEDRMAKYGVSIAELTLMSVVKNNSPDSDDNVIIADIQKRLFTSKAAVSKMLGVLERKGFVNRDVNRHNRRELVITLTEKGANVLNDLKNEVDGMLENVISKLGQEKTEQIINAINQFSDAISGVIE